MEGDRGGNMVVMDVVVLAVRRGGDYEGGGGAGGGEAGGTLTPRPQPTPPGATRWIMRVSPCVRSSHSLGSTARLDLPALTPRSEATQRTGRPGVYCKLGQERKYLL